MASGETELIEDAIQTVSEDVVQTACNELCLTDPATMTLVTDGMREIANNYLLDLSIEPYFGTPKAQRAALRKLADALVRALCRMGEIAPEYAVALKRSDRTSGTDGHTSLFVETQKNLIALKNAIDEFDQNYEPRRGKPTNVPLETAVRDLIDLIEPLTGAFPKNAMGKHSGDSPRLKSPEALAIGKLLQGVDKQLNETTIVNMIEKVSVQPKPAVHHLDALFRADPDFELDCSLHSNRQRD